MHRTVDLGEFAFECGRSIPNLRIAYETYGEFTGENAVLVCHALTGSAHVAHSATDSASGDEPRANDASVAGGAEDSNGDDSPDGGKRLGGQAAAWWDDVVGPGKAIDTTEYYVVCANVPGSCYGSSGPASPGPDGEPYGTDFPAVTVADWTRAQRRLLDHLGVETLHAVVGGSVGGMNALEWVKRYPDHVDRVVPVAAAARLDPQCLALDAIARRAITTDPNWNGGDYYVSEGTADGSSDSSDGGGDPPDDGLAQARRIGHVMYLSKASMADKFGRRTAGRGARGDRPTPDDPAARFFPYRDVESYLDYNAGRFTERFDANSYLYLTRAMDDYDLGTGAGSDAAALASFDGEALLLSFTGDWHFTVEQSEHLAESFRRAGVETAHHVVESDHGHDAFLVEPEAVGPPIAAFLAGGVDALPADDAVPPGDRERFAPVHASLFST